jgi:hypothetical protein
MIKIKYRIGDGKPFALIGLTEENIARLVAGEPILFDMSEFDMPPCIFSIAYGKTERDLLVPLAELGIIPWSVVPPPANGQRGGGGGG